MIEKEFAKWNWYNFEYIDEDCIRNYSGAIDYLTVEL